MLRCLLSAGVLLGALAVPAFGQQLIGPDYEPPADLDLRLSLRPTSAKTVDLPVEFRCHPLLNLEKPRGSVDTGRADWSGNPRSAFLDGIRHPNSVFGFFSLHFEEKPVPLDDVVEQVAQNVPAEENPTPTPADGLELPEPPPSLRPERLPLPALYRLPVTVRQSLAGSLLFCVHPLLTLTPTADFLDAPSDHPQPVAGDDWFETRTPEAEAGTFRSARSNQYGPWKLDGRDCTWYEWFVGHVVRRHTQTLADTDTELVQVFAAEADRTEQEEHAAEQLPMP
jgi:hypothetical protein